MIIPYVKLSKGLRNKPPPQRREHNPYDNGQRDIEQQHEQSSLSYDYEIVAEGY